MINAFLVFNGSGQPRLTKFYTQLASRTPAPVTTRRLPFPHQHRSSRKLTPKIGHKHTAAPHLRNLHPRLQPTRRLLQFPAPPTPPRRLRHLDDLVRRAERRPSLVTYRNYATLFFIIISTSTESPLALIDLIQVYVEALDRLFENVCELDLIFNFESLHAALSEMIVGGVVVETNLDRIVSGVRAQGTVAKRPVNESRGAGLGAGLGMGTNFGWSGR
ncbi:unnamed protein product [Parascedosporium putredinis]|uniref:AP complex subunit sigma n=1 Tax=Parascedosporium putredinis TaxID=1442378 RepID=A0A9P1MBV2_9PEZI|nr:unnamed protein product [Parascedosporium putredinis]CAI7999431.1 unnamed protein product [Parascedosporium putredinis]